MQCVRHQRKFDNSTKFLSMVIVDNPFIDSLVADSSLYDFGEGSISRIIEMIIYWKMIIEWSILWRLFYSQPFLRGRCQSLVKEYVARKTSYCRMIARKTRAGTDVRQRISFEIIVCEVLCHNWSLWKWQGEATVCRMIANKIDDRCPAMGVV